MALKADILTSAIVVVGDFNPAIFSPDWLERNKLIGSEDADGAREGSHGRPLLVSHQVSTFETEWFALRVLENQLTLTSKGVLSPALKDLAVGIFQIVSHTPVTAVGLNFIGHYKFANPDDYHKIGDVFAPKDIWAEAFPEDTVGTEQVTVRFQKGTREEPTDTKDEKRITLQPSALLKQGVSLAFNDHHDVTTGRDSNVTSAEQVALIVDEQWEDVWGDAVRIFNQLLTRALEQ